MGQALCVWYWSNSSSTGLQTLLYLEDLSHIVSVQDIQSVRIIVTHPFELDDLVVGIAPDVVQTLDQHGPACGYDSVELALFQLIKMVDFTTNHHISMV